MKAPKEVKRWHREHPEVPLLDQDWQARSEIGESATGESATNYYGRWKGPASWREHLMPNGPDTIWWWEERFFPWESREEDLEGLLGALDDLFAPYLSRLPKYQEELVRQIFNDRQTYAEVGQRRKTSAQAAHQATRTALRNLVRLVAEDDPDFVRPEDGRRRDYAAENEAALRVLKQKLKRGNNGVPSKALNA